MNAKRFMSLLTVIVLMFALVPAIALAKGPGGGGHTEPVGNNLSFPVIAVDGFAITSLAGPSFTVPYTGTYPGITADEIAYLLENGPWYAQKTEGNVWQAQFATQSSESVTFINWGDNIESVNPKIRRPFRLEITLYKMLPTPMNAYTMAELEYPSSSNELQGTNAITYESPYATVVSSRPRLVVQHIEGYEPTLLTWDGSKWISDTAIPRVIPVKFAPELNVGGKYIFGASEGGWKPDQAGYYRITFSIPSGSGIDLSGACIDNFPPADPVCAAVTIQSDEGGVATPYVVPELNLTYVDVQVLAGRR